MIAIKLPPIGNESLHEISTDCESHWTVLSNHFIIVRESYSVRISTRTPVILAEDFYVSLQLLHTNTGIV
jgi:hypothetical protein